jgi:hypothetical protein
MYIGDVNLINNDGLHGRAEASGRIGWKAKKHAIIITFFERGAGQALELNYDETGISKQLVPPSKFYRINIEPDEFRVDTIPSRESLTIFSGSSIPAGTLLSVYDSWG